VQAYLAARRYISRSTSAMAFGLQTSSSRDSHTDAGTSCCRAGSRACTYHTSPACDAFQPLNIYSFQNYVTLRHERAALLPQSLDGAAHHASVVAAVGRLRRMQNSSRQNATIRQISDRFRRVATAEAISQQMLFILLINKYQFILAI